MAASGTVPSPRRACVIPEKLHLSPRTVETYRENIKRKLDLNNANELARHAVVWVLASQE